MNETTERNVAIGYLRAFVTLLVLLHHSVLAYATIGPKAGSAFTAQPFLWAAFPVVDSAKWRGFDFIAGFNDIFFMSLMFFISGLFVPTSLARKGSVRFLSDRVLRLGIPFAIAAALLAPLAYYPAWLQSGGAPDLAQFWRAWIALPFWPAGPAWFLWVLVVFGSLAAIFNLISPRLIDGLGRFGAHADAHPWRFFFGLIVLSAISYIALSLTYDPYRWLHYGPFTVQASRMLHYAVYYFAGIAVGASGFRLLSPDGKLARRWWLWLLLAPVGFILIGAVLIVAAAAKGQPVAQWETLGGVAFALSCGLSSFALTAVFVRFAQSRARLLDSLSDNAYGMYVVHYVFVAWTQYLLLGASLSGVAKGFIVFGLVVILSWSTTALLRRAPGVARILGTASHEHRHAAIAG
jgi:peptidoglycan/LPS O-acetylase OafA/YrhL